MVVVFRVNAAMVHCISFVQQLASVLASAVRQGADVTDVPILMNCLIQNL